MLRKNLNYFIYVAHFLECFNNVLYGFFAVMLAPVFFSTNVQIASFGAFAAGFFARPIGAILFGMLGDKYGRRLPLIYSMTLIGIPTILIGLIPDYHGIGILAPCILIVCRTLQGFFNGGEFAGITLLIAESENKINMGARAGLLVAAGVFGAVFAALIGAIAALDILPTGIWRLPFILGGLASLSFVFATKHFQETKAFNKHQQQTSNTLPSPWRTLIDQYKLSLVCAILLSGFTLVPIYLATIFGNQIFKDLGYTHSESMTLNAIAMAIDGLAMILFGKLSDKIGFHRQITLALSLAMIVAFPAFYSISMEKSTLFHAFLFIIPLVLTGGMATSCAFIHISRLFPVNCRYSALAFSVTLGQAVFGGTTPMIAAYMVEIWETKLAPALGLIVLSAFALLALELTKRQRQRIQSKVQKGQYFENKIPATTVAGFMVAVACMLAPPVSAKLPLPRFVSLRANQANVRVGPGRQYPIQWVLVRRHLPLEIIAEFDTWRKVKDPEGEVMGWIHQGLLSGLRTAVVLDGEQTVYRKPALESFAVAKLEPGVITKILKCRQGWCRVQVDSIDGWIEPKYLWGVYPAETIK
ncbi:MAG: MFS transporter [Pseudomonadota bacterium]